MWGVGTNLITSKENPAFGGVYKMAAISNNADEWVPKIKLSENPVKVTNPGVKKILRLYDTATGKMKADYIALADEELDPAADLTIFDPLATWKRMTLPGGAYTVRELLVPVFTKGKCVYESPPVMDIRAYAQTELNTLWDEHKRLTNPHIMPVDLSQKLYDLKRRMITLMRG
jgi:nicotinate phosphoribosyltransferase